MACLKAGNLSSAREKFNRCLKPPVDLNQLNHGSRLVQDVIQYLESTVKPVLIAVRIFCVLLEHIAKIVCFNTHFAAMHDTISGTGFFPSFVMITCCKLNITEKFTSCYLTVN